MVCAIGRTALALLACAVIGAAAPQHVPRDAPRSDVVPARGLEEFMARKLAHSQALFGALTVNDLERASAEAQKLGLLGLDESWFVIQSPEYAERTVEFRRTIASIDRAARAKDLGSAQLAYLALAGQCFSCHRATREPPAGGAR